MSAKGKNTSKPKKEASKNKFIQKFKGKFKDIKGGGTILFTNTIQSITDPTCLAVYIYLASKPPEWEVNVKELMRHFEKLGRDKARKALSDLCQSGLTERKEIRKGGKFLEYSYYLYLKPLSEKQIIGLPEPEIQATVPPGPEIPGPEIPAPVNQYTYKEKIPQKEKKEKKLSPVDKSTSTPKPKKPTVFDYQQHAHGIVGYEWVADHIP